MQPNKPKYTHLKFGDSARQAVIKGVFDVCDATAVSLGPLGNNVLIEKEWGEVTILHDGVSIANTLLPENEFERAGAKIAQEAAKRTRDLVGDGTSVTVILLKAILQETLKVISARNNAMTLRRGLEQGADKVIKKLQKLSQPVKTLDQKIQIATISAEDETLGKLIAETIHKIGDEGVITVEESKAVDTYVEYQEGMQIDKGFAHYYMITDSERRTAVLEDVPILVTDLPLTELAPIGKFLENEILKKTLKCVFISPDIGGDFLTAMIGAKYQGKFLPLPIRAPGLGPNQTDYLQDICALTGATFITHEAGHKFDDFSYEALGHVDRIVSSSISTIITGGAGHKQDILQRIQSIRGQMKDETLTEFEKEQLKARLGKLTSGVAVVKVAGQTEIEMKERKERAIDAIASTQSAVKHGLVAGGEIAYLACLDDLDETSLGEKILKDALKAPFKRLVENAGYDSGELLAKLPPDEVEFKGMIPLKSAGGNKNMGFDVVDGEFKDMIKAGIIDASEVPITAVKTAVSVAVQLSSLGAAIVLQDEENNKR